MSREVLVDFVYWLNANKSISLKHDYGEEDVDEYLKNQNTSQLNGGDRDVSENEPQKKFCAYCGTQLEGLIFTDLNSIRVCKNSACAN